MQDGILRDHAVPPLLSLIRDGSPTAQERAAHTMWSLSTADDNQKKLVQYFSFIVDLVTLLKNGSPQACYFTAATLAELADGSVKARSALNAWHRGNKAAQKNSMGQVVKEVMAQAVKEQKAAKEKVEEQDEVADGKAAPPEVSRTPAAAANGRRSDVLLTILDAGGIPPLVKLCEHGTVEGKNKAAACLFHLSFESELQKSIAASGGIKPLVSLFADGTEEAFKHASDALTRLAFENPENQAQIAKRLVGLLDYNDPSVVSRAAHDLQSLAQSHPKAPMVIVSAGAISPLVSVLSNGKTEEGRAEASKTLYTLANSGEANQTAIAIGLVALLGVGTDLAQECVTELLLTLSSPDESDLANRQAIAKAGPFKMLVQQMRSANGKVRMLAAAVMSRLSGDSTDNVETIAVCEGIQVLVKLLDPDGGELGMKSQHYSTIVLAHVTCVRQEHAISVTEEDGTAKLVAILLSAQKVDCKARAASVLGNIAMDPSRAKDVGEAGATEPLIDLLKSDNRSAQQAAAFALAGIAAGGKKNQDRVKDALGIDVLVQLLKVVVPTVAKENKDSAAMDPLQVQVQANVAKALAELARDNEVNQNAIAKDGGLLPLISLVNHATSEQPKEEAAGALWQLSSKNHENQSAIAAARGMESLVSLAGRTTARGQEQAAGALYSLALNHLENQTQISQLLVQLLRGSSASTDSQEKAARAISRFARADLDVNGGANALPRRNQDALAEAQCIGLTVALLQPKRFDPVAASKLSKQGTVKCMDAPDSPAKLSKQGTVKSMDAPDLPAKLSKQGTVKSTDASNVIQPMHATKADLGEEGEQHVATGTGGHRLTQRELCAALWSLSERNEDNQKLIAHEGGIPLLIALLNDHPEIHCEAAGALWSLAAEATNQRLIAEAAGIPKLCELLKPLAPNVLAQETATGALHRLAANADNRNIIADADGISLLIPLFDGGSTATKQHVTDALLALTKKNTSNQFIVAHGLVAMLSSGLDDAQDAISASQQSRVEAQTHATRVLYTMSLDRDNRDAFSRTGSVVQLVRQLKSGSDEAQAMASDSLTNIARISADLRIQVTAQLVTLLSNNNADVRQRAGTTLRNNNSEGNEEKRRQKQAAISSGVGPLVDLLKAGLADDRVEAQEYALRSLSMINDANRRRDMVEEGCIPAVTQSLSGGKLSADSQEHAITVLAGLSVDRANHDEIIKKHGISPLIEALSAGHALSTTGKCNAAVGLAHLAADDSERQSLICDAIEPLVKWLVSCEEIEGAALRPAAAHSLASICRGNQDLQKRVAQANAIKPLVSMLEQHAGADAHRAACGSLATLAVSSTSNQKEIADVGAIPLLIDLMQDPKPDICENACFAVAMLSDLVDNKVLIANAGGIKPLIQVLSTGNPAAQQFAARAASLLALENPDNQIALVLAAIPLADLLGSDSTETQEWAQLALLRLALNPSNRNAIVKPLVGVLISRNTSAQLKAAECLAMLLERCPVARTSIAKAGAVVPLVQLLGNGRRADLNTPTERAAAVLSELVRLAESKVEVVRTGGLEPLVAMLFSPCLESQAHAACALWHLSVVAEHKPMIIALQSINPLVALLTDGSVQAQRCAARTLWQLSSLTDAKALIVQANGISALVTCLSRSSKSQNPPPPGDSAQETAVNEESPADDSATEAASVQEAAAAILSELARTQSANRALVVDAGGLPLIMDVVCEVPASSVVQQHVTRALWGLSQERHYRTKIAQHREVIFKLVELLSSSTAETQKLAAATLVTLGQEEVARILIVDVVNRDEARAHGTLQMLKFVKDSWLRSQVEQLMMLVGIPDASSKSPYPQPLGPSRALAPMGGGGGANTGRFQSYSYSPRVLSNPSPMLDYCAPIVPMPTSPRVRSGASGRMSSNTGTSEVLLARFQAKLEANPDMWMMKRQKEQEVTDLYMADLAVQIRVAEKVVVATESSGLRKAIVRFVGKAPELAPGFWVGVEFDKADGKNDGSVGGTRYFRCEADHGSFLRPNLVKHDTGPVPITRTLMASKVATVNGQPQKKKEKDQNEDDAAQSESESGMIEQAASPSKSKLGKEKPKLGLKGMNGHKEQKPRAPTARMGSQRGSMKSPKGGGLAESKPKPQSPKSANAPETKIPPQRLKPADTKPKGKSKGKDRQD